MATDHTITNKLYWNEISEINAASEDYAVDRFLAGRSSLKSVELELLGDVQNLRILHLQCHIGLDSMSLSRMGAQVTAVDFSEKSIEVAQHIQIQARTNVDFVVKDTGSLQENELGEFDIVYATYGILPWIDDLARWMAMAGSHLKTGGRLILIDEHPFVSSFSSSSNLPNFIPDIPYFQKDNLYITRNKTSYADRTKIISNDKQVKWFHSMGSLMTSIGRADLLISAFSEYPFVHYKMFGNLEERDDGWWESTGGSSPFPLLFALEAKRP